MIRLPIRVCWSCIALGLVVCLYGPLVWAQDAAHVWGPDWQQIALWFGGLILFFIGVYAQWQRTSIKGLDTRITEAEKGLAALEKLLLRDYQSRTELNRILDGMTATLNTIQNTNLAIHRRLGELGVPYTPPT